MNMDATYYSESRKITVKIADMNEVHIQNAMRKLEREYDQLNVSVEEHPVYIDLKEHLAAKLLVAARLAESAGEVIQNGVL